MSETQSTHWAACATEGGQKHYPCAVREIAALRAKLAEADESVAALAKSSLLDHQKANTRISTLEAAIRDAPHGSAMQVALALRRRSVNI